jgi:thiamine biosynthesis lipoprotein
LVDVLDLARRVHERSEGAFDPTVGPLVAAFGFGPEGAADESALPCFGAVTVDRDRREIAKTRTGATLDLSGIAKGHAVDRLWEALREGGAGDVLVEIGGELRAAGHGPDGAGWPVGVQEPGGPPGRIGQVIRLRDEAMATSGTYWQRRETPRGPVNHVIDPRTRRPVEHDTVSVTVIAPTAASADAWATALLVLGGAEGPAVAEREGVEALFLRRPRSGGPGSPAHE